MQGALKLSGHFMIYRKINKFFLFQVFIIYRIRYCVPEYGFQFIHFKNFKAFLGMENIDDAHPVL